MEAKWSDAGRRLLTISIGAPSVFFIMYLGGYAYVALVALVGLVAAIELQGMINKTVRPIVPLVLLFGSILVAGLDFDAYFAYFLLLGAALTALQKIWQKQQDSHTWRQAMALFLGSIYVGLPLAALLLIRDMPNGLGWTYMVFTNNWATDAFALIGGRLFGRTKMAPSISSGKTVEGAIFGLVLGILLGMIVTFLFQLPLIPAIILNALFALLTILGDLIESIFKRYYAIKDTGQFLPGHGGVLDRIDGLVLSIIPLYAALLLFI